MPIKLNPLSSVLVMLLLLPACSDGGTLDGNSGGAAGATASGGMGGSPASGGGAGVAVGGAGASSAGAGTGGSAAGAPGGGAGGTVAGASGAGGNGGAAGSGGSGPAVPPNVVPQSATTVPSEYGGPVAMPGMVTNKTYPVHYYIDPRGSVGEDGSIPRQDTAITKPVNIYTPPSYDPQTEYPLLFVLHGITDNENTWMERGVPKPNILLDNLITSKVIKPLIAVFPQGNSEENFKNATDYGAVAGYHAFGNELMKDLMPFIEANYKVKKDRGSRAIAGFSMGGMQTINVGLCQNLQNFAWFGALHPQGGNRSSADIAACLEKQNAKDYPVYYLYMSAGKDNSGDVGSVGRSSEDLTTLSPYITSANFSTQTNYDGDHNYPSASKGLYNFIRMAFGP
jgi:enterochelin esterase-like enzyme